MLVISLTLQFTSIVVYSLEGGHTHTHTYTHTYIHVHAHVHAHAHTRTHIQAFRINAISKAGLKSRAVKYTA